MLFLSVAAKSDFCYSQFAYFGDRHDGVASRRRRRLCTDTSCVM